MEPSEAITQLLEVLGTYAVGIFALVGVSTPVNVGLKWIQGLSESASDFGGWDSAEEQASREREDRWINGR